LNNLIIASAGSGKTDFIVNNAIEKAGQGVRILITTFTEACEQEIRVKIVEKCGISDFQVLPTVLHWPL